MLPCVQSMLSVVSVVVMGGIFTLLSYFISPFYYISSFHCLFSSLPSLFSFSSTHLTIFCHTIIPPFLLLLYPLFPFSLHPNLPHNPPHTLCSLLPPCLLCYSSVMFFSHDDGHIAPLFSLPSLSLSFFVRSPLKMSP